MEKARKLSNPETVKTSAVEFFEDGIQIFLTDDTADWVFDITTDRYGNLKVSGEIYEGHY